MGEYLLLFQKTQAQFLATVFNSNAKGSDTLFQPTAHTHPYTHIHTIKNHMVPYKSAID